MLRQKASLDGSGEAPACDLYKAPLFKHERSTFERIEKFISKHHFVDCNLYGKLYSERASVTLKHCEFGHEQVGFATAVEHLNNRGVPVQPGFTFGPTWTTHWFQVDVNIPSEWKEHEVVLRFDAQSEALVWSENGRPLWGLSPDVGRTDLILQSTPERQRFFIEASASDRNGDGDGGAIRPAKLDKVFEIKLAELRLRSAEMYELFMDFDVLLQMAELLPKESSRRYEALYLANDMVNKLVMSDFSNSSLTESHQKACTFFSQPNGHSQLTLYAIGNCHIDTAWLWRYNETRRKCARSWVSALALMEKYKSMKFAVSQTQQLLWVKDDYPTIFEDMQDMGSENRLSGVGGAWVEMDGNIPSGESMMRQLLYGQQEFTKIFGRHSQIFWLPDTFGYSAQLPQIMKHCDMLYFVTQKMSWSLVNKFPHHSFHWYGIDGTSVLAHFPPHHYCSQITVKECIDSAANFTDRGRSNVAMMLYGHGDGGGGPDENMLKRAERLADCDGVPRVRHASPEEFFIALEKDAPNLCCWKGELYLELHNATYTTQAYIKKMNRLLEGILRDQEFIQTVLLLECGRGRTLRNEWQKLLLNQFHDVLPGTCIREAVEDAKQIYRQLLEQLVSDAGDTLKLSGEPNEEERSLRRAWVVNSSGWPRTFFHNKMLLQLPPLCILPLNELKPVYVKLGKQPLITECDGFFLFNNAYFSAKFNKAGQVLSFVVKSVKSETGLSFDFEAISDGNTANSYAIFNDVPLFWDAWDVMDYHLETRKSIDEVISTTVVENSPLFARLRVELKISAESSLIQEICIRVDLPYLVFDVQANWRESHKFLKVEFPVNVNSDSATYEIQYGHISRPTHRNTSWDSAKYEVCGHKWMAIAEHNRGVAILNNCKYGHSCDGRTMRLSLLRSSKSPDDTADIGEHKFSHAFWPFIGTVQEPQSKPELNIVRAAYEFNNPIRFVSDWKQNKISNLFGIHGSTGVVIDAIKPSEADPNAVIIRMYESFGGGCQVRLVLNHGRIISVDEADGLEKPICNIVVDSPTEGTALDVDSVLLSFRAFEIKTLLVRLFAL